MLHVRPEKQELCRCRKAVLRHTRTQTDQESDRFSSLWCCVVSRQKGDVGFVEEAWTGDSGIVFCCVIACLLFFILSFASRSQLLKGVGRFVRPCLLVSLRCTRRQRLTSLERISPPKSLLRRDSGAKISCGSSTLAPREEELGWWLAIGWLCVLPGYFLFC